MVSALLDNVAAGLLQSPVNLEQLLGVLDLDPEMIEARLRPRVEIAKFTRGSSSIHFA